MMSATAASTKQCLETISRLQRHIREKLAFKLLCAVQTIFTSA